MRTLAFKAFIPQHIRNETMLDCVTPTGAGLPASHDSRTTRRRPRSEPKVWIGFLHTNHASGLSSFCMSKCYCMYVCFQIFTFIVDPPLEKAMLAAAIAVTLAAAAAPTALAAADAATFDATACVSTSILVGRGAGIV